MDLAEDEALGKKPQKLTFPQFHIGNRNPEG